MFCTTSRNPFPFKKRCFRLAKTTVLIMNIVGFHHQKRRFSLTFLSKFINDVLSTEHFNLSTEQKPFSFSSTTKTNPCLVPTFLCRVQMASSKTQQGRDLKTTLFLHQILVVNLARTCYIVIG